MAGDWIKIRVDLTDDPAVFMLSDILKLECPTLVGHLVMFWSWMNRHTSDGTAIKLTENVIDKKIGVIGFASAMRQVGWLSGHDMALELPHFERHNGDSAKARALESEAKRLRRNIKDLPQPPSTQKQEITVGQMSDNSHSECPTREEKRRVEKNTTKDQKPSVLADDRGKQQKPLSVVNKPELITKRGRKLIGKKLLAFELFWNAFDYKKDRAAAADAWYDLELDDDLFDVIIRSAKACAITRPHEITAGRTPIYPQGWLTGRRWEDEAYTVNSRSVTIDHATRLRPSTGAQIIESLSDRSWAEG
jgi:hypothetical protein